MIVEIRMRQAVQAVEAYHFKEPLSTFLKKFFKNNPKMGSKDRREVSDLVYNYIRVKNAVQSLPIQHGIALANYVCTPTINAFATYWGEKFGLKGLQNAELTALDRLNLNIEGFNEDLLFPATEQLSEKLDKTAFFNAMMLAPHTFIRVLKEKKEKLLAFFEKNEIAYEPIDDEPLAFRLPRASKLTDLDPFTNGWFEIQDLASQQTSSLFRAKPSDKWWDACAASGGKTLLLHAIQPKAGLFVSDNRDFMLDSLISRFRKVGITSFSRLKVDLTQNFPLEQSGSFPKQFDGIILDAPCSGSGTWRSTPELALQFKPDELENYHTKQVSMAKNVSFYLKTGAPLVYLTCSVYQKENEAVVNKILETGKFDLEEMKYFQASGKGGDVLFGARLIRK